MTQDLDDDAEFVAAFEETKNNGRCIDWRYWAKRMPVWTPGQAARLMCALDPDVFESYENQPTANKQNKAIATAKRMERLAHAQKVLALAPSEWLEWAVENGFCVSPWLHQVVTHYNEEKRPSRFVDGLQERMPQEAVESAITRLNDHDWTVKKPGRYQGYGRPLFEFLKSEKAVGRQLPTPRDVLDAFKRISPPEVIEVLGDGMKYYDGNGNSKVADLNAIRKAIQRMTVKAADSAG